MYYWISWIMSRSVDELPCFGITTFDAVSARRGGVGTCHIRPLLLGSHIGHRGSWRQYDLSWRYLILLLKITMGPMWFCYCRCHYVFSAHVTLILFQYSFNPPSGGVSFPNKKPIAGLLQPGGEGHLRPYPNHRTRLSHTAAGGTGPSPPS